MSEQLDTEQFQEWIGKTESNSDFLTIAPMAAMAATLDKANTHFDNGSEVPPLWHWLYFLGPTRQSQLAADGHAARGDFLPPIPLPRRMWAGSRFEFHQPLHVGEQINRNSKIKSIEFKSGRSGQLAFICVQHEITSDNGIAISEEHDIVYRDNPAPGVSAPDQIEAPPQSNYSKTITPDPVFLFRYSALTFNGHRIHYDRDYVTNIEGYPGLIVHGPLLATLLVDSLLDNQPGCRLEKFEFKAMRPVFDLNAFEVCGVNPNQDNVAELWIQDHDGALCMKGRATISHS